MRLIRVTFVVVFAMIVELGSAHAACSNASVAGTFGLFDTAGMGPFIGTGVGQITFDGVGNVTGNSLFISYGSSGWNGSGGGPGTGTYTIAANCTGNLSLTDSVGGKITNFNFVVNNLDKKVQFVQTFHSSGTFVQSGFALPEVIPTCSYGASKRTFATNLSGSIIGTGPVAYVGQLILGVDGSITGSMTLNVNGTVTDIPSISGTYTEASNCTGTATITAGTTTMNFYFVAVYLGTELLMVETDANTVVSGNGQL